MLTCSRCSAEMSEDLSVCPACGAASDSGMPTFLDGPPASGSPAAGSRPRVAGPLFATGTVLASRFRIVSRLGRGGMGEVYRAEDLKLNQAVALKFLSLAKLPDPADLARFRGEVRLARQIAHPNVCRVFDLIELDGDSFLCMEYIDGENLEALVRRIGRLSPDKACEIARQLAAGLAAIHNGGLLHRDLKPANVMIDGRGRARITDFGLALPSGESGGRHSAGTPAYMAPEQRARGEIGVQSDLYSLGLVLYEMFTGRPAQLADAKEPGRLVRPANLVDIDPQTEATLLQCLEPDPRERPASALHVAAGLFGGDPLAAALAAGVTLSPEAVAAAPTVGNLRPAVAVTLLVASLAGLGAVLALSEKVSAFRKVPFDVPPQVLTDRARGLLHDFGYPLAARDWASGFALETGFNRYLIDLQGSPGRKAEVQQLLARGQPPLYPFWYCQSPAVPARIEEVQNPSQGPQRSGACVLLDTLGRLYRLEALPPRGGASPRSGSEWLPLLKAAGLDTAPLEPSTPREVPPVYADRRAAWDGTYPAAPGAPAQPIHVEAGSAGGAPVWFRIFPSWSATRDLAVEREEREAAAGKALFFLFGLSVTLTSLWLLLRNLRAGRGDKRGALRLTMFKLSLGLLTLLLSAPRQGLPTYADLEALGGSAFLLWMTYLAFEPYARRLWPEWIISWSRLWSGKLRDPLVGRDLLIGSLFGLGLSLSRYAERLVAGAITEGSGLFSLYFEPLRGPGGIAEQFSKDLTGVVMLSIEFMITLLMFRLLLRHERLALTVFWAAGTLVLTLLTNRGPHTLPLLAFAGFQMALHLFVWMRFGLLAGTASNLAVVLCCHYPLTLDLSAWYADASLFAVLVLVAISLYGFFTTVPRHAWFGKSAVLDR